MSDSLFDISYPSVSEERQELTAEPNSFPGHLHGALFPRGCPPSPRWAEALVKAWALSLASNPALQHLLTVLPWASASDLVTLNLCARVWKIMIRLLVRTEQATPALVSPEDSSAVLSKDTTLEPTTVTVDAAQHEGPQQGSNWRITDALGALRQAVRDP